MNQLENQIDKIITYINNNDVGFGWKNHCNRLHTGKYISGEPFDYIILTAKYKIVFDAKETISNKWQVKQKDKKQAINLLKCYNVGMESFFLIYFKKDSTQVLKIDILDFLDIMKTRSYIKISDCKVWNYKELFKK